MTRGSQTLPDALSLAAFRAFTATRPDKERWELIDGLAIKWPTRTLVHQHILANLELLFYESFENDPRGFTAFQSIGVNVSPLVQNYDLLPDLAVTDTDATKEPDTCYADRFYLVAEVASPDDRDYVERKRQIYKLHDCCKYILTMQEDHIELHMEIRTDGSSNGQLLPQLDDVLTLPDFGLRCRLSDLYRGTWPASRHAGSH